MYPTNDHYFDAGSFILAYTPKAGSTSIRRALHGRLPVLTQPQVHRANKPVRLIVRQPIERLVSAWWMFRGQNRGGMPQNFTDFALWTLRNPQHRAAHHWIPQTTYHTWGRHFLPTEGVRLEDLATVWPEWFPDYPLGHENKGDDRPNWTDTYASLDAASAAAIDAHYASDLKLYSAAR